MDLMIGEFKPIGSLGFYLSYDSFFIIIRSSESMEYAPRSERISLKYRYIRTLPGLLKLIQLVCDVVALILGIVAPTGEYTGHRGYLIFVAALAIVVTLFLFSIAFINLQAVCIPERWPMIEMYWCAFIAILYVVAGVVVATAAKNQGIFGAAAFFAFAAFIAYLIDGLNRFRLSRRGPAGLREEVRTSATTTTVTRQEPTY